MFCLLYCHPTPVVEPAWAYEILLLISIHVHIQYACISPLHLAVAGFEPATWALKSQALCEP